MVIRVYISGNSGNKEIVTHQQRIFMILNSLHIPNEPVDISAPGMEKERDFMREKCKKKEGQRHALPPQIFNGEDYRGNFEDFDIANEDDHLEEFLGILRKDGGNPPPDATATAEDNRVKEKLDKEAPTSEEIPKAEERPVEEPPPPAREPSPIPPPKEESPEPPKAFDHDEIQEVNVKPEGEFLDDELDTEITQQDNLEETANKSLLAQEDVPSAIIQVQEEPLLLPDSLDNDSNNLQAGPESSPDSSQLIPAEDLIYPGSAEYDALMRKRIKESEDENPNLPKDIPALGPSLLEDEVPLGPKRPAKLVLEVDETKANAGFQNIMNAARFWKASQIIGTP